MAPVSRVALMVNDLLAAGSGGGLELSPHLLAALVPLLVLIVALDVYCLIDLARAKSVRSAPKLVWAIIIVFVSAPLGALATWSSAGTADGTAQTPMRRRSSAPNQRHSRANRTLARTAAPGTQAPARHRRSLGRW